IYLDNLGFTTFIRKRVLIDDFNDDIFGRNSFLNWTGWGGSDTFEVMDIALHTYGGYKTNNAKKITYNIIEVDEDNWFASNVWDNTFFFDASDFEYLSFWVKGEARGEDFYIQLQYDEPLIEEEPEEPLSQIHSADHFTVTTEWQQINVPIEAFTGADKTKLRAVSLGFYYPLTVKQGTIPIDNLEFSNGYGKPESTGQVRVNRETKALLVNGQPYNIKGVGYQPTPIGRLPPHPDNPVMYDRDFPLLVNMGCNTIRIWGTPWDDPDTPEVELNRVNLFDKAGEYGLKVIAGFWMPLYLDYSDFAIRQNIKEDFINFVNAYKDSPALLAWAIGNGNNDILGSNPEYYSFVNELAEIAYCLEGPSYHSVMVVNENLYAIGTYERDADDLQLDYVDVWGSNVFMESYNFAQWFDEEKNYFRVYEDKSTKPLVITSYGTDAFCTTSLDPVDGYEDEAEQEEWVSCNTIEIMKSPDICIGGCVMEYSDEWWKDACDDEEMPEDPYHLSIHDPGGLLEEEWWHDAPDDYANEEYWGIVRIEQDGTWDVPDGLDDIEARSVYYSLQELFIGTAPTDPELRYKKYFIKDNWFGRSY
ncbi:hypothetical protein KA005_60265, partial [bacterium]|nr:hypothetical protein [bacterium]